MNKEALQTWVAALRSGEYKQAQWMLHDKVKDSYCCIGVGNKLFNGGIYDGESYARTYAALGFTQNNCTEYGSKLITMNDNQGKSFAEIADWVEKTLIPLAEVSACGG